jgi:hypothetical protein
LILTVLDHLLRELTGIWAVKLKILRSLMQIVKKNIGMLVRQKKQNV